MPKLTKRETRLIRITAVGLGIYLLLFAGWKGSGFFRQKHAEYLTLAKQAQTLGSEVRPYQDRAAQLRKLMESFNLDPAKLSRASIMAQASAAIQKAAMTGGVQLGPVRESPARPGNKELGSMQLEAMGPVPALLKFVYQAERLGFPLIIETLQIGSEPNRPGPLKLNLTILILDFDQWKKEESSHA